MEIRRLQLTDFRNYATQEIAFAPGLHVFAGANAQGKTNLLEAVYLAATGRSARTSQEGELVGWEAEFAYVTADFVSPLRGDFTVEVSLGRKTPVSEERKGGGAAKRIKVNGAPRNLVDLAGLVPVVLFLVEDLEIIRGEPARRREFLDTELSATSRTYGWTFRQYSRVVDQRNRLLKEVRDGLAAQETLVPWNEQLAVYGGRVLEVRTRFVNELNAVAGPTYQGLTSSTQAMSVAYRREWGDTEAQPVTREEFATLVAGAIDETLVEEMRRGSSLVGPHRDDLQILVDGRDIRQFGSQGEQRTAALALRVAEFNLLHQLVGEPPVLLLDDVLSELDRRRRAALLAHLAPIAQVILTTTDVDAIGLPPHAQVHLYHVEQGTVTAQPGTPDATG